MRRQKREELKYKWFMRKKDSVLFRVSHYTGDATWAIEKAFAPGKTRKTKVSFEELQTKYKGLTITSYPFAKFQTMKEHYRKNTRRYTT